MMSICDILRYAMFCDTRCFDQEVRTEAVFQTPDPVFDRTWVFVAPSYDSVATIDLVDAATDRSEGRLETSIIALLQVQQQ